MSIAKNLLVASGKSVLTSLLQLQPLSVEKARNRRFEPLPSRNRPTRFLPSGRTYQYGSSGRCFPP